VNPIDVDRGGRHGPIGRPTPVTRGGSSGGLQSNAFNPGTIVNGFTGGFNPADPVGIHRAPPVNPIEVDRGGRHGSIGNPDPTRGGSMPALAGGGFTGGFDPANPVGIHRAPPVNPIEVDRGGRHGSIGNPDPTRGGSMPALAGGGFTGGFDPANPVGIHRAPPVNPIEVDRGGRHGSIGNPDPTRGGSMPALAGGGFTGGFDPADPVWSRRAPPPGNPIEVDRGGRHGSIGNPDPTRGGSMPALAGGGFTGGFDPADPVGIHRAPPVNPIEVDRGGRHGSIGNPDPTRGGSMPALAGGGFTGGFDPANPVGIHRAPPSASSITVVAGPAHAPANPAPITRGGIVHMPISIVPQDVGDIGDNEVLFLITTLPQYQQLFGDDATGVNFNREWAFLYSAGLKPTGGYEALVVDVSYMPDAGSLVVTTSLVSPGMNCAVPQIFTTPHVLVKFPKPPGNVASVFFNSDDQVLDCQSN